MTVFTWNIAFAEIAFIGHLIYIIGLVVAVKDHEHFRLKMLFTQKKKIEHENKQIRADRENYKVNLIFFFLSTSREI